MTTRTAPALRQHVAALRALLLLTVVLGLGYPMLLTGLSQVALRHQANGSLVQRDGRTVGSSLIGQSFEGHAGYFQSRPSAAGEQGYDALASSASNLGPENADLVKAVQDRRAAVAAGGGVAPADVPPDALLASGSGLDPHVSPAYARLQAPRVARARGLDVHVVERLVDDHVQSRVLGFLGEPRVNVLELNLALDRMADAAH